ncbi:PQQ-dependent sugar dehydrogenase [Streptomyces lonarensis]|uniref:PQQ-dependent sugar dehydrogenase n=1 Tax=Streptomyces lonarensis TaxID=700599 RepID=A0A7X6D0N9_9ACTN|nr:PQQ-dependent sugar dehydrogenase [Streptomyces lonarensis]NJQ05982.1 PQQ-dependent sugar dehydrogenase [Streptomyces lonarensis]
MSRRTWTVRALLALSLAAAAPLTHGALAAQAHEAESVPAAASSGTPDAGGPGELTDLAVTTEQLAFGLARPTAIAAPDDGSDRLLITEKAGTVRVYHPDTGLAAEPLLDVTSLIAVGGNERGLLGIATGPDFADTQHVYLAYTAAPAGDVTLARHHLADGTTEVLLSQDHPNYSNHNGGQLAFGADGFLYWSLGDGGGAGDPDNNGQRVDTLLGTIVRVDVNSTCGELPYCVPEDNPWVDDPDARSEIWATGLRNAWRFSVDPADNSLWIADVGQGRWEEINHLPEAAAGANLGWSCLEGLEVFDAERCLPDVDYHDPVLTYRTSVDGCAVIGGHVYRGERHAELAEGVYLATDYCSSIAWAVRPDGSGKYEDARVGTFPTQVTAFGTDVDGELYVVNDLPGQLHRVGFEAAEDAAPAS